MNKKRWSGFLAALCIGTAVLGSGTVFAEDIEPAAPEGTYYSELTGEPIDLSLQQQRPIAAMVDNESLAYPHFGTAEGDVVYELMNSTANGRITRLMVLVKDWDKIVQLGSIRSVRPTNILLAAEWNAVLCHDGGPFYVDSYFAAPYATEHFSGGFTRVNNGKSTEFTEYITAKDLEEKFASSGFSKTYNEYAHTEEPHFSFVPYGSEETLSIIFDEAQSAKKASLPFPHTTSELTYDEATGEYVYHAYGDVHRDAEDQQELRFKNVILQDCDFTTFDSNGYMVYNCVAENKPGYFLTNGEAIPITWTKDSENGITKYYDLDGDGILLNRGKTFISLVPEDSWENLVIE